MLFFTSENPPFSLSGYHRKIRNILRREIREQAELTLGGRYCRELRAKKWLFAIRIAMMRAFLLFIRPRSSSDFRHSSHGSFTGNPVFPLIYRSNSPYLEGLCGRIGRKTLFGTL
jgi:hypothetical protein